MHYNVAAIESSLPCFCFWPPQWLLLVCRHYCAFYVCCTLSDNKLLNMTETLQWTYLSVQLLLLLFGTVTSWLSFTSPGYMPHPSIRHALPTPFLANHSVGETRPLPHNNSSNGRLLRTRRQSEDSDPYLNVLPTNTQYHKHIPTPSADQRHHEGQSIRERGYLCPHLGIGRDGFILL